MTASYAFSLLFQLPLIAVLAVGLVLVGQRKAAIGPRATLLARSGLALLLVHSVLQAAWTVSIPMLYQALRSSSVASIGVLSGLIGVLLALVLTIGVGLLIAAVVTRTSPPSFPGQFTPPGYPGPGYDPSAPPGPGYPPA
jgi:hypothetical protein